MKQLLRYLAILLVSILMGVGVNAQTNSIELKNSSGGVLSTHSSITDAIAAIPSTLTQAYVIEITSTYTGSSETLPITFPVKSGASASNTITLRPASGVSSVTIGRSTAGFVLTLDDADWVIIDGRPGGSGTTKALTFAHTGTTSSTVQLINGATRNVFRYCKVTNGGTTGTSRGFYITTSASNASGNSYNLIENCIVDGGRYGINTSGTAANPNAKNRIYGTEIINNYFAAMWVQANTLGIEVDSCKIYYSTVVSNTTAYGILFDAQTDSAIITRNHIYDLDVSTTSAIAGIIIRSVSGSNYSRFVNNMISLTKSNGSTSVNGIDIGGTVLTTSDIFFNSVRIGGTLSSGGTSGNVVSAALYKDASNTSNSFDIRNNILVNERSGGNSGTQHVAMAINNTNGTNVVDYNTFNATSGNLTRWGTVVSATIADHQTNVPSGNALNSNDATVNFVSTTNLHVSGSSLSDFNLKATPITSVVRDIDNNPRGGSTYRGADDDPLNPIVGKKNDIGVISIDEPMGGSCGSTQAVKVTVKNNGINQVDTFTVNWSINGTLQSPVTFYQLLDTVLGSGSTSAQVSLGTFSSSSGIKYNIKSWTSGPNNLVDPDKKNDSSLVAFSLGLAGGTYTVGGTSPDFTTLSEVVNTLNTNGVCGPVVFNIRSGTYNEKMNLGVIPGSSTTNTITFKSETGVKSSVKITSAATSAATDNFTIFLNGTDNIIIRDLTLERSGSGTYSTVISIDGVAENIVIHDNTFIAPVSTASDANGTRSHIFGALAATTTNVEVYNNLMQENSNGLWLNTNTSVRSTGTKIYGNTITSNYTGVFVAGQLYPQIYSNKMVRSDQSLAVDYYGISMNIVDSAYYIAKNSVESNRTYGIRLRDCYGNAGKEGLVINNMVAMDYAGTASIYGITNELGGEYQLFAHNTCLLNVDYTSTSTTAGARAFYMQTTTANAYKEVRILNNIFYSAIDGVAAWFTTNNISAVTELDYNLYYSGAENIGYVTSYYTDFASFKAATGKDEHSYNFIPKFAGSKNPHILFLQKFAYGRNDLNITEDFDGDVRCVSLPTVGADEYSSALGLPSATFIGPNTAVTGDRVYFLFNGNANQIAIYKWYVNGVYQNQGINFIYTFPTAGSYDIMMVAENCTGTDSLVRNYTIIDPTVEPTANFSSDRNQIYINESVKMTDLSLNGPTTWHWSVTPDNGVIFSDSTEQDPLILFTEAGKYEVCLIADNAIGSSAQRCRTSYIEVYPILNMCAEKTSTFERGKIYDDGGSSASYAANQNCSFFINPCASEVTLKFNEWTNTDADDKLIIYDGDTTDENNIIATIAGGMTNPGGSSGFTAKSGRMWLIWHTDAATQYAGFDAEWTSVPASTNPTLAGFNVPDTLIEDSPYDFINTSTGSGLTYFWDFDYPNYEADDANRYGRQNPTKTFSIPGVYKVFLESTNCLGSDSAFKDIVVISPTKKPTPDFGATLVKANTTEEIRLLDLSGNGPSSWKWEITPSNGVLFLDPATSRNPRVVFNFGGKYTVKLTASNTVGADSIEKIDYIEIVEYCRPNVLTVNTDVTIRRVVFEQIDQSSTYGVSKYSDFSANGQVAQVAEGGTYTINIERNTNNEVVNFAAWIDLNQDGDFEDLDEMVLFDSASTSQILTTSITIPAQGILGLTRMRVGISRANLTTQPCGPVVVGEYEDYKINIGPDDQPPVITLVGPSPQYVEVGHPFIDSGAVAFDNVDGNITANIMPMGSADTTTVGSYTITYTITDALGNTASVDRVVIVTPDVTAPIFTLNGADTVKLEVFDPFVEDGYAAIDNPFGTDLTPTVVVTGNVDTTKIGTYVLTYTVVDNGGNKVVLQRVVIISDNTKPVITLTGNNTIDHDGKTPYIDLGATVIDNYDAIINYTVTGSVDVNVLGTYTLVYKAVDASGNVADSVVRTVTVVDRFAPTIKLVGNDIVYLARWEAYTDSSYVLSDNFDDSVQVTVDVLGDFTTTSIEGLFYIQYRATDLSGNVSLSSKRVIYVNGANSVRGVTGEGKVSVYPNPSNGNFTVEASRAFGEGVTITVTNVLGATVYQTRPEGAASKAEISLDGVNAGVYFVNISNGNRVETTRIIIR